MRRLYVFKRLWSYVANYKVRLFYLILIALVGVGFEVAKPLPIKLVIDNVLSKHPLPDVVNRLLGHTDILQNREHLLLVCIGLIVFISFGSAIVTFIVSSLTVTLSRQLVYDLSVDFYSKLQRLSLSFYSKNQTGDLTQRMSGDVFVVYLLVAQIILPVLTSLICLTGMFYIMAQIDTLLAVIAFAVVPLLGVLLAVFVKPMNTTATQQYKKQGQLSAFVQQSLSAMKIIQAFGRESFMHQKMEKHAQDFGKAFQAATKVSLGYNQLALLITGLASAALIGLGAYRGINGALSAGDLFIFLGYIAALYGPVNSLSTAIGGAIAIGARAKRIFSILDSNEVVQEKSNPVSLRNIKGAVMLKDISFGYGDQNLNSPVLHNMSFNISPGEVVAIVGPTGAGKTSLISLLTRFYDPWEGKVLLDGVDIRDMKLHTLRENISLVLQEPYIFPMSVADNIAFGNPAASFEEIVEAAKAAQAHHFISKLPEGYNTMISESGSSLSGGEKQRISIARAFLKQAPILIMDEPTSAVDALTEAKIFKALSKYSKGKTVFIISHRLSTIKHADQIITIQNGTIVETGTHEALIKKGALYADLYKHHHIN